MDKRKAKDLRVQFPAIIEKPFFIKNILWSNQGAKTVLNTTDIPSGLLNNPLVRKPFETTALYRTRLCIMLQVAGTPMHMGTLLVAAVPNGVTALFAGNDGLLLPTLMSCPHVFVSANESTSVCLDVPFYSSTPLIRTDILGDTSNFSGFDYGEIIVYVLNPLGVPTSGSTTLSVSMHAMFKDSEFYIPHVDATFVPNSGVLSTLIDKPFNFLKTYSADLLDAGRNFIRQYTGLHNVNIPVVMSRVVTTPLNMINYADVAQFFEKLDIFGVYNRIPKDYLFFTKVDEMDILHILAKPQYLGTFDVSTTTAVGKVLWSRPMTPYQTKTLGGFASGGIPIGKELNLPIEQIGSLAKYWRGSLKIHIQSVMTSFHFVKLLVAKDYSPVTSMLTTVPQFADVPNLITDTLEFSNGGQVQTITLDYMATTRYLPVSMDLVTNGFLQGIYYIYLLQPLVFNGSVPLSISFNVYISAGEDFQFYGYSPEPSVVAFNFQPNSGSMDIKRAFFRNTDNIIYSNVVDGGDRLLTVAHAVIGRKEVIIDKIAYNIERVEILSKYDLAVVFVNRKGRNVKLEVSKDASTYILTHDRQVPSHLVEFPHAIRYEMDSVVYLFPSGTFSLFDAPMEKGECGSLAMDYSGRVCGHHIAISSFGSAFVDWDYEVDNFLETHWNYEIFIANSSQEVLLNNEDEGQYQIMDDEMRPLVSIRDLARKLQPIASYTTSVATGLGDGILEIPVSDILGLTNAILPGFPFVNANSSSILSLLMGLYRGFSGSLKIRLAIEHSVIEPLDTVVYYLPPGGLFMNTFSGSITSLQTDRFLSSNATLQLIQTERTSHDIESRHCALTMTSNNTVSLNPDAPRTAGLSSEKIEFVLPNYIFSDIVGDIKNRIINNFSASVALGSIIVRFVRRSSSGSGTNIFTNVYAGLTDESRYGMQTLVVPRLFPTNELDLGSGLKRYLTGLRYPASTVGTEFDLTSCSAMYIG